MARQWIIAYDIAEPGRLHAVAAALEAFGTRVQKSVFECRIDDAELAELQQRLARLTDPLADQVRYYRLCQKDVEAIVFDGPVRSPPTGNMGSFERKCRPMTYGFSGACAAPWF